MSQKVILQDATYGDISNSNPLPVSVEITSVSLATGTEIVGKVGIDQVTDGANAVTNKRITGKCEVTFNRKGDTVQYAAGDVVGDAETGTFEFINASTIDGANLKLKGSHLIIERNTVPAGMTGFMLYLFDEQPTGMVENSPFNLNTTDTAKYLGRIYFPLPADMGDTLMSMGMQDIDEINLSQAAGTNSFWMVLVTLGTETPASGTLYRINLLCE